MKKFLKNKFSTLYFFYQYIGNKIYAVFGFSALMVVMDSIGLALFIPLLQIADQASGGDEGDINGNITLVVNRVFGSLNLDISIQNMLMFIVFIFILKGIFTYYSAKYKALTEQMVSLKMRTVLANSVKNLSYKEFVMTHVGRMQNSLIAEVGHVIAGCTQYMEAIKNILFVAIYLSIAFILDWRFSLLVILGGGLTNWIYRYFYKQTQELSREITKNNHQYGGVVIELMNHFKYFKATGRNDFFFGRLQNELENVVRNQIKVAKLNAKLISIREPMTIIVICCVILLHVTVFKSPLTGVIIILLFFYRVMQKVVDIQTNWNNYLAYTGTIENIIDYQKYLDFNKDTFYCGNRDLKVINSIKLKEIQVKYGDVSVLNKVNIEIKKYESIAFVGESGSGKTTLVNVISALLPFSGGEFLLNDVDIKSFNIEKYKSKLGYISQEPTVFNATIFENVTFWSDKSKENLEKFNKVIDACSLRSFLSEISNGEDALLGNNGINLSGGQKQRISIARELFRDVELLIMDEATSALDSETENFIRESLENLKGKITIIAIAHRLSTVKTADRLFLMDKGKIVQYGNFEQLKDKSTYFRRLTELQGM